MSAHDIVIATEGDLRAAVPLDMAAVEVTERAFRALTQPGVEMPPILSMHMADAGNGAGGEMDVKTAYLPGFDGFALKISTGFFGNAALGLPSLSGMITVLSAQTGRVQAALLDNGYLTDLRTAAAGAVAARALAPNRVEVITILGTGLQARLQARAALMVRPGARVLVWGRNPNKAAACAADIAAATGARAEAATIPAAAVAAAQLVITTTPSRAPILIADWLTPGTHVTAMGSDAPGKQELDPACLARADLYVPDRASQCATLGELRAALEAGTVTGTDWPELGQVLEGAARGRTAPDQITLCDLTGTGAQDTAIASHALAALRINGAGYTIPA
jgi:ornithine cyclodeaminase